jgi:hypothetical protein
MERSSDMSREMISVIQALIILFVTAERILPTVQRVIEEKKEQTSNKENGTSQREVPMSINLVLKGIFSALFLASVLRISTL